MAQHSYTARIAWEDDGAFPSGRYSRAHEISFDGGARLRVVTTNGGVTIARR